MTNIAYPPARPLSVGEVLDLTFRIYRASVIPCLVFAGLGVVANQLPNLYSVSRGATLMQSILTPKSGMILWLLTIAGLLIGLVFSGAVVLRQYAIACGRPVGGELAASARRLPSMLLWLLLIFLTFVVAALIVGPAFMVKGMPRVFLVLVLLIPFMYAVVAVSCSFTAMLISPMAAAAAYIRSWRLTSGSFWRLSLIYLVGAIVLFVLYVLTSTVTGLLIGIIGRGDIAVMTATLAVVAVAVGALATPFYLALALAVFGDLSARKEGTDLAQRIAAT